MGLWTWLFGTGRRSIQVDRVTALSQLSIFELTAILDRTEDERLLVHAAAALSSYKEPWVPAVLIAFYRSHLELGVGWHPDEGEALRRELVKALRRVVTRDHIALLADLSSHDNHHVVREVAELLEPFGWRPSDSTSRLRLAFARSDRVSLAAYLDEDPEAFLEFLKRNSPWYTSFASQLVLESDNQHPALQDARIETLLERIEEGTHGAACQNLLGLGSAAIEALGRRLADATAPSALLRNATRAVVSIASTEEGLMSAEALEAVSVLRERYGAAIFEMIRSKPGESAVLIDLLALSQDYSMLDELREMRDRFGEMVRTEDTSHGGLTYSQVYGEFMMAVNRLETHRLSRLLPS